MSVRQLDAPSGRWLGADARWAIGCGLAGLLAGVFGVIFFTLSDPFGASLPAFNWSGPANDVMVAIQFATFTPVAAALRRRLPPTPVVSVATLVAMAAMAVIVVLQLLLVLQVVAYADQIVPVLVSIGLVFAWVFLLSSFAHRRTALPRSVTLTGVLLSSAFLVGAVLVGTATLLPTGSLGQRVPSAVGIVLCSLGWLGLWLWPFLLARRVFRA